MWDLALLRMDVIEIRQSGTVTPRAKVDMCLTTGRCLVTPNSGRYRAEIWRSEEKGE